MPTISIETTAPGPSSVTNEMIAYLYSTLGILSETDRQKVLKSLDLALLDPPKKEKEKYVIKVVTSTGF